MYSARPSVSWAGVLSGLRFHPRLRQPQVGANDDAVGEGAIIYLWGTDVKTSWGVFAGRGSGGLPQWCPATGARQRVAGMRAGGRSRPELELPACETGSDPPYAGSNWASPSPSSTGTFSAYR